MNVFLLLAHLAKGNVSALCFSFFLVLKKIEKASEMQQPSCKSKSFGLVL
jgi:hypothetical protein